MEEKFYKSVFPVLVVIFSWNSVCLVNGGETCTKNNSYEYCDYGCCGSDNNEYCCTISTSVLVVACVVGGLVLLALIAAIVICCYRNYKDKQASRVRRIRQQEDMNAPRVPGVEPPKPPSYISAPPAYSEEMPESHFRPATVTGNIPYNQRFRGTTPVPRRSGQGSVRSTHLSGRHPMTNSHSNQHALIPGIVEVEAPPPYTEYARGQTPAHRRQRFIRTPVPENAENSNVQNVVNADENTDIFSEVTQISETPARNQQSQTQETNSQSSRAESSRATNSRAFESRAITATVHESRAEHVRENESRAESVARILGSARISRIPTRVNGAQSRQVSNVSTRLSSVPTRGTAGRGVPNVVTEDIDDLAVI